ncbi:uncharacterized protein LOC111121338 [Crassostrea virginica]
MEIRSGIETRENLGPFQTVHKGKMNLNSDGSQGNRKIFQTLQSSAHNPQKLTGQIPVSKKKATKLVPLKEPLNVYKDPQNNKKFDHKAVQTEKIKRLGSRSSTSEDIDQEAFDLMVSEEVPESYWKELAEQRRIALNDSLHENEMLHKEVEDLREENSKLSEMAEKADYFADVIQTMLGTDEGEKKEHSNEDEEDEKQEEDDTPPAEEEATSSNSEEEKQDSPKSGTPETQVKE